MIAHIEGKVSEKKPNELILDVGGVGFQLICSNATLSAAPAAGETMRCYTHLSVREDAMELFGFATREEREMFRRLCGVSGVGPRTALGILSALPLRELALALVTGDANAIARAPGVGKKTAQRLILELKDKVEQADVNAAAGVPAGAFTPQGPEEEAVSALITLGYSSAEARGAVAKVSGRSDQAEMLILLALKGLGG